MRRRPRKPKLRRRKPLPLLLKPLLLKPLLPRKRRLRKPKLLPRKRRLRKPKKVRRKRGFFILSLFKKLRVENNNNNNNNIICLTYIP
jgi:hypothetical protein